MGSGIMTTLGKYELLKKIATGGMAEVWLARQSGPVGFQRSLVVKRMLPHLATDPQFVQMLLNEAKIAARLSHPNIAQIYDLGDVDGEPFIAMEFVRGRNLGRLIRKAWSRGFWIAQAISIRIAATSCEALAYAHEMTGDDGVPLRIVHRDISPQNILISFDGSVKLVDFGIAKAADVANPTMSGQLKGKFAYMSPEQAMGKPLDCRSDLFALGLVLYELLTGVRPLQREGDLPTLAAAKECEIAPPSAVAEEVDPELDGIVMRALSRHPEDRYQNAREFQMALEEYLVARRWVATSLQISELMDALFSDNPKPQRSSQNVTAPVPNVKSLVSRAVDADAHAKARGEAEGEVEADVTFILPAAVESTGSSAPERTRVYQVLGEPPRFPLKRRDHEPEVRLLPRAQRWRRRVKTSRKNVSIEVKPRLPKPQRAALSEAARARTSGVFGKLKSLSLWAFSRLRSLLSSVINRQGLKA